MRNDNCLQMLRGKVLLWLLPHATIRLLEQSVADVQQARRIFTPCAFNVGINLKAKYRCGETNA